MKDLENKEIGNRIRNIRINHGLSMEEFGKLFSPPTTKGTISKWENGKYLPNNERLKKIADLANITVEELLSPPLEVIIERYFDELMTFEISQGDQRYKLFYDLREREKFLGYLFGRSYEYSTIEYGIKYDVKNYTEKYLNKYFELKQYVPYSDTNALNYTHDELWKVIRKVDAYFKAEDSFMTEVDSHTKDNQIKEELSPELYSQIRIAFENLSDKLKDLE